MPVPSLPFSFSGGQQASSAQVDANFTTIYNWANGGVDYTNVGAAGFYASQIVPTGNVSATFGGTSVFTFPAGLNAGGPLTATTGAYSGTTTNSNATTAFYASAAAGVNAFQWISGQVGGAVSTFSTTNNNANAVAGVVGRTGQWYNGGSNFRVLALDDLGNLGARGSVTANGSISAGGAPATIVNGDVSASRGTATGAVQFGTGGSGNSGLLDYGLQNAGAFTFQQVGGTVRDLYAAVYRGTGAVVSAAAVSAPAGSVAFGSGTATSATAGTNGAPPSQVAGYLIANVGGTNVKLPYYAF